MGDNGFFRFDHLEVFKKAYAASLDIHKHSLEFPQIEQFRGLADQVRRSSKSICANLAEGLSKRGTVQEEMRYLKIALGSCEETALWLRYATDLRYIREENFSAWIVTYGDIAKMIQGLLRKRTETRKEAA